MTAPTFCTCQVAWNSVLPPPPCPVHSPPRCCGNCCRPGVAILPATYELPEFALDDTQPIPVIRDEGVE